MRRWLCCARHVEDSYQPHENEHMKSLYGYGIFLWLSLCNFVNNLFGDQNVKNGVYGISKQNVLWLSLSKLFYSISCICYP